MYFLALLAVGYTVCLYVMFICSCCIFIFLRDSRIRGGGNHDSNDTSNIFPNLSEVMPNVEVILLKDRGNICQEV